jgi:hypothetical protein
MVRHTIDSVHMNYVHSYEFRWRWRDWERLGDNEVEIN